MDKYTKKRDERIEEELAMKSELTRKKLKKKKEFGILTRVPQRWHRVIKSESKRYSKPMSKILGEICESFYSDSDAEKYALSVRNHCLPKTSKNEFLPSIVSLENKIMNSDDVEKVI